MILHVPLPLIKFSVSHHKSHSLLQLPLLHNHGNFDVILSDKVTLVLCSDNFGFMLLLDLAINLRPVLKG